jgi:hypothetical protein
MGVPEILATFSFWKAGKIGLTICKNSVIFYHPMSSQYDTISYGELIEGGQM